MRTQKYVWLVLSRSTTIKVEQFSRYLDCQTCWQLLWSSWAWLKRNVSSQSMSILQKSSIWNGLSKVRSWQQSHQQRRSASSSIFSNEVNSCDIMSVQRGGSSHKKWLSGSMVVLPFWISEKMSRTLTFRTKMMESIGDVVEYVA